MIRKGPGKSPNHAICATNDLISQLGINLAEPRSHSDASGQVVQFRNAETSLRQNEIGPQHAGQLITPSRVTPERHHRRRLALIEQARHPSMRATLCRLEVELIARLP